MIKVVYTETEIVSIIKIKPNCGTTYTTLMVLDCDEEVALDYFSNYPPDEYQRLVDFIENNKS